jgi:hypothetical protein
MQRAPTNHLSEGFKETGAARISPVPDDGARSRPTGNPQLSENSVIGFNT